MKQKKGKSPVAEESERVKVLGKLLTRESADILAREAEARGISLHALFVEILEAETEQLQKRAQEAERASKPKA